MNLREYATNETAAFVDRLVNAAEAAAQDVRQEQDALVEDLRAQLDAATAAARTQRDEAEALADGLQQGMASLRAEKQEVTALLSEAIEAFDALATASTIADLFTTLVEQLATRFPRVVMFRRKGARFAGELASGLDEAIDLAGLQVTSNPDSIISRAAMQGEFEHATLEQLRDSPVLPGEAPVFAVAAPLVFQGETVAVIYADSHDEHKTDAHAAFAGVLVAHTSVLLSRLKQELKITEEMREYAQMLLHEADEMFVADTKEGRTIQDRLRRLRETIDFGRQLYAQRAAIEGAAVAGLLEEEITALIETEPVTGFGSALSAALAPAPATAVAV